MLKIFADTFMTATRQETPAKPEPRQRPEDRRDDALRNFDRRRFWI